MNDNVSNVLGGLLVAVNASALGEWLSIVCTIVTVIVLLYRLIYDVIKSLKDGHIDDNEQEKIDEDIDDILTVDKVNPALKENNKDDDK